MSGDPSQQQPARSSARGYSCWVAKPYFLVT